MTEEKISKYYSYDKGKGIWKNSDYKGIDYSDGSETEKHLKSIVDNATDISVMSPELAGYCKDWPTTYHLSSKRSNLFRPFEERFSGKSVLEIGAGCGAITRYLGESGAEVIALEGTPMRASITASRCRDLDNVIVIADSFQKYHNNQQFDFVTLVGVLEYATLFVEGDNPVQEMLKKAKEFLKPDGVLFIAIENQLGLKYFSGYAEDHVGKPMFGIEDHYENNTVITFGRRELESNITQAGFMGQQLWCPFPDYKMPTLMVPEESLWKSSKFDLTTLIRSACTSDLQTPKDVYFFQERAWGPVLRNNLLSDLSNSFLVLASVSNSISQEESPCYAIHYASDRRPEFSKKVVFEGDKNYGVIARQIKLYPNSVTEESKSITHYLKDQEYVEGELWLEKLMRLMSTPGWTVDSIRIWFDEWWLRVKEYEEVLGIGTNDEAYVDGSLMDAIPRNLFIMQDKTYDFIDQEWVIDGEIKTSYLKFRALLSSFQSLGFCAPPSTGTPIVVQELINETLMGRLEVEEHHLVEFLKIESDFQFAVSGSKGFDLDEFKKFAIRISDTQSFSIEKKLKNQIIDLDNQLALAIGSISWRVTAPLRYSINLLRSIKNNCYSLFDRLGRYVVGRYRMLELGSLYNGEVFLISGKLKRSNPTICLFSHFDKDGLVDDYVLFYLMGLKKVGVDIAFISTSPTLSESELDKARQFCDVVIHKENIGYDYGAWKTGLDTLSENLDSYDEIILCNDSVYAPLYDMKPMFESMRSKEYDFWGITNSLEKGLHLQSYFLVFNKNVFSSEVFRNIWSKYRVYSHKENIINKYEVKLMRRLSDDGFVSGSYCPCSDMSDKSTRNTTHHDWDTLISDFKCPIIKIELLRDNPVNVDISDWEGFLSRSTEYNVSLIETHLKRIRR